MTSLNIHVPDTLANRLRELAEQTGRTKSYYVRKALEEKLEDLEDFYLAMEALENVESGQSRTWTQDELEQDLDNHNEN